MKNISLLIAAASLMVATSSYGAIAQSVSFGGGNPSTEGWAVTTGAGGEFNDGSDWALYGSGSQAVYTFGDLGIGESAAIDFSTLGVGTGDYVGVDFQDGGTTGIGFNFLGGGSNYNVFDGSTTDSGIGFTTSFQTITLTNIDDTNYTLNIAGTDFASLTLTGGATAIDSIRIFNDTSGSGNDVLFNNLNVVVPEPSTYALLAGILAFTAVAIKRRK